MKRILLFGTFTNYFARFVVMLCNYGTSVYIARMLGPNQYGIYAIIFTVLNLLSLMSTTGILSATSKYVAHMPAQASAVKNSAFKLTGLIALIFAGAFFFLTIPISDLLRDRTLSPYLRMTTLVIIPFFLYPVFLGYFNGLKKYHKQAIIKVIFAVANFILIVGFVYLGFEIYGAIVGFALGALIACLTGYFMAGRIKLTAGFSMKKLLLFAIPFTILSFTFVGTRSISLLLVKSLLGDNNLTAYYNIALRICIFPHNLSIAIAGALLPLVAQSFSSEDKIGLVGHILKSLKYLAIFLIPLSMLIIIFRQTIVSILYGQEYIAAVTPIKFIAIAEIFVGIEFIFLIVLSGIDKHKFAMIISISVFCMAIVLNLILIPKYSVSGAAVATLISYFLGAVISAAAVFHFFRKMKPTTE